MCEVVGVLFYFVLFVVCLCWFRMHWVTICVCYEHGFLMFAPLCQGEDFEYVDCFVCFGYGQVYVSVVSEFGVKCES